MASALDAAANSAETFAGDGLARAATTPSDVSSARGVLVDVDVNNGSERMARAPGERAKEAAKDALHTPPEWEE